MSIQVSRITFLHEPSLHPSLPPALEANILQPGGKKILTRVAGKDASKQFWKYHNDGILKKYKAALQVGSLDSKKQAAPPTPPPSPPKVAAKPAAKAAPAQEVEESEPLDPYGDLIPFADPSWYQGVSDCESPVRFNMLTSSSTTPHTSTNPTLRSETKSAHGSLAKSNLLLASGMKHAKSQKISTSRWALAAT